MPFESLPGFREFYPERTSLRNFLFRQWRRTALSYGFQEYDGPVLEPLELFTEKSGPEIVSQLFNFTDKGDRDVALRPELTPTLARMVGAKAGSLRRPIKWFAIAECFRYEKPQKGRLRSFYQFNADIFGEEGPSADAELIALCIDSLRCLGLREEHFVIRVSDRSLWLAYLASLGVEDQAAMQVLGVVDKIERQSPEDTRKLLAPMLGDQVERFLSAIEEMRAIKDLAGLEAWAAAQNSEGLTARIADWKTLFGILEAMELLPYLRVDLGIVRGLAYYTGFVFEAFERTGKGRALAGGGRYDKLVEKLGYNSLHGCGFAVGDVTVGDLLEDKGLLPPLIQGVDCYCVIGNGEAERQAALKVVAALRRVGISADYPFKSSGFGKQFKTANQSGARLTLIFGESEVASGAFKMKDMQSGGEAEGSLDDAVEGIRLRLESGIQA